LKILHVSPYFRPARNFGGSAEALYRLCLNLARLGCDVRVLTTNSDGPTKTLKVEPGKKVPVAAGFEVTYSRRLLPLTLSPGLLIRLPFEMRRVEVVHLTGGYAFTTIPTLLACRLMGKPLVWSPRGALNPGPPERGESLKRPFKRLWNTACRMAAPRATMLHLISETERTETLRSFPNFSAIVIPDAVKIPANIKHPPGDGILRLGYIGRLHPRKGLENLLEACRILKNKGKSFSLVIAGAGRSRYSRSLARKIESLALAREVQMIGEVHGGAKRDFFEGLDLLMMPSHTSTLAPAVAEGLAFGVPVIASRFTPWARLEEQGCGLWVDNGPQSLAQAIEQMREMPVEEMSQRGREWMLAEFSWDAAAREVCDIYFAMLQRTARWASPPAQPPRFPPGGRCA
jgi:glycosyltransferase involved in cell wall biosynthesis